MDVVRALLDAHLNGAKEKDQHGNLPLQRAAENQALDWEVVRALLEKVTDVNATLKDGHLDGHTALSLAQQQGHDEVAKVLEERMASGA